MWWVAPIVAGIAAFRFFSNDATGFAWIAVIAALAGLWSAGIAANYGKGQERAIPDYATFMSMGATVGGIVLLAVSFFV